MKTKRRTSEVLSWRGNAGYYNQLAYMDVAGPTGSSLASRCCTEDFSKRSTSTNQAGRHDTRVRFWLASAIKSIIQSIRIRPNRNRRRQLKERLAVRASAALLAVAATIPFLPGTAVGQCDGPLFPGQPFATGNAPVSVITGDFNGDGVTDLATANSYSFDLSVLLGNGDGTFSAPQNFFAGNAPQSVVIGDFNGDGVTDLAMGGDLDFVSVLLNQCVGDDVLLGDVNQDGAVSLLNVQPFVDLLNTGGFQAEADINQDGEVTLLDVAPFVDLLTGG